MAGFLAAMAVFGDMFIGESPALSPPVDKCGVRGGLAVWIGCQGSPADWAETLRRMHRSGNFLVLGLDADAQVVGQARDALAGSDDYGEVSVDLLLTGRQAAVPMIDDSVNLLVVSPGPAIPREEVLRVLAPFGVALVAAGGGWERVAKPWPGEIDEWTHYLHDASNNAVAEDQRIGPLRHLQWQCGPRWSRHHDHMASVSAMVSTRGRLFYLLDEGSYVSPQLPSDWKLIGRDAFSGALLWKRPIAEWHDGLWPLKSGPASLPRRLVAEGDAVYATLGIAAPVTALDAASGETLREYAGTAGAEEILYTSGVLLVLVNHTPVDREADLAADVEEGRSRDSRTTYSPTMARIWAGIRSPHWTHADRSICAFDAESGRALWEKAGQVIPLTLAADAGSAYYHDGDKIVALDLATGNRRWTSEAVPVWQGLEGQGLQSWFAPTLVVSRDKVLFAGGEKTHMSYMGWGSDDIGQDTMTAFSAATGGKLWTAPHPYAGYNSPEDLFVVDGKVWTGNTAKGGPDGRYVGRDLATGELDVDFPPTLDTHWFHHRCYRAKATDKYVLCSRTGIEFVDLATGEWTIHHWVRGGCLYGIMPANGLVYAPPHPCACYPEAKLYGFVALAAERSQGRQMSDEEKVARDEGSGSHPQRLQHGPAFPPSNSRLSAHHSPLSSDWPTYRHDAARSGASEPSISARLRPQWRIQLGTRLTQPVVAEGRLFVADVDCHTVHAIDASSGQKLWSYVSGGRIDSPPTICDSLCLFGSADGYVSCLRADDGALAWRFRAAPADRRMVAFDQVESVWPVHGSVLVQDGVATVVAGRSMYLDGGLRLCRLDVASGRLLGEKVLDDRDPETGENMQTHVKSLNMPVALPDVLSSDGEHLFMRSQAMDLEGNRLKLGPEGSGRDHLFAAYGFGDDTWFHRTYWLFGDSFKGGVGGFGNGKTNPAGRILVHDGSTVFGYGRKPQYYRWSSVLDYQLFATAKSGGDYRWTREVPLMVRAMALAGDTLLIAGPEDLIDEEAAFQSYADEVTQKQLAAQDAALTGQRGAIFQAVDAGTGQTLADYRLDAPPVFDGLIVAAGRVYLATMDGRLVAFGEAR